MQKNNALRNTLSVLRAFWHERISAPQPKPLIHISSPRLLKAIRYAAIALWLLFPFFCFISCEYISFMSPGTHFFGSDNAEMLVHLFTNRTGVVFLDLIILYIASLVISCIVKRLWVSCVLLGVTSFVLSAASFFKYQVTGEYFYPWDLRQTGNVGILNDYINTDIPPVLFVIGAVILLITIFVALTRVSLPIRWNIRIPAALITVFALCITYSNADNATHLVDSFGMDINSVYKGEGNYTENGFLGALTLNILSQSQTSPQEYSEQTVADILSSYSGKASSESFSKPNIIVILQESFWDIRQLPDCSFSADPLENYDRIVSTDGVYSGTMLSPTFGGGTVRPEFELLTGLSADYLPSGSIPYEYISDSFESYPSLMKKEGYRTLAIHPYLSSFYSRDEKYPLLGFDETLFNEDLLKIKEVENSIRGGFTSDDSFVSYIEYFVNSSDRPLFLFGISMEGHQPYDDKFSSAELNLKVTNPAFDEELENTVSQYAQCLADADKSLGRLISYVDSLEEDTIVIVFGDHAPSLGADKAAYRQSGYISPDGLDNDDMKKILSTPFFIYTNFAALGSSMLNEGEANIISPYNLLNAALELTGAPETPLMEFLKDYYGVCPAYNFKLERPAEKTAERFIKAHEYLSYDRLRGYSYSVK